MFPILKQLHTNTTTEIHFKTRFKMEQTGTDCLKSIIRSIILSEGTRCNFRGLTRGFQQMEGKNLAVLLHEQFNKSILQFLLSIPDVCKVNRCKGEVMIELQEDESSENLEHLVELKLKEKNHPKRHFK
jgi:hypothetical protein